jgi:hypothetical protein
MAFSRESFYKIGRTTFALGVLAGLAYSTISMFYLPVKSLFPQKDETQLVANFSPATQPIRSTTQSFLEQQAENS